MSFEQFEDRREAFIQKYVSSEPTHVGTDIKPWLVFDQRVLDRQAQQPEFATPIWTYLERACTEKRIMLGRQNLRKHAATLDRIEDRFGVDRYSLVAIWGIESQYGQIRGDFSILSALATLAFCGRRQDFFEQELRGAIEIITWHGLNAPLNGSWAGAFGHTQFMPSSYLDYAISLSGDTPPNLWDDNPSDALASTAHYLASHGWGSGQGWGARCHVPPELDYALTGDHKILSQKTLEQVDIPIPDHIKSETYSLLAPAGALGPFFAVTQNYHVLKRYNASQAYVLAVGHLADALKTGRITRHFWPRHKAITLEEIKHVQRQLTARGYSTQGQDGIMGPNTVSAIRDYQRDFALEQDGYLSPELIQHILI